MTKEQSESAEFLSTFKEEFLAWRQAVQNGANANSMGESDEADRQARIANEAYNRALDLMKERAKSVGSNVLFEVQLLGENAQAFLGQLVIVLFDNMKE